jgi:hypothetical protein
VSLVRSFDNRAIESNGYEDTWRSKIWSGGTGPAYVGPEQGSDLSLEALMESNG